MVKAQKFPDMASKPTKRADKQSRKNNQIRSLKKKQGPVGTRTPDLMVKTHLCYL